jgi:polyisoprenoid-binding protein YceI
MTIATPTRNVEAHELPVAGTWQIDRSHTSVEFIARHLMIAKVRGRFTDVEGTIEIGKAPEQSSAHITIQAASISTGDDARDAHLRSADFLDAERFPTLEFHSTSVEHDGSHWLVGGDLTVRDVIRPVVLEVEFDGAANDPFGNSKIAFSASSQVNREDFGLTWNAPLETGGVLVGPKVRIELNVEAVRS